MELTAFKWLISYCVNVTSIYFYKRLACSISALPPSVLPSGLSGKVLMHREEGYPFT